MLKRVAHIKLRRVKQKARALSYYAHGPRTVIYPCDLANVMWMFRLHILPIHKIEAGTNMTC
jgi:hypothetical protein